MRFPWLKGHGTENDFILLPDHDGTLHGNVDPEFIAALCHRRRGLGADGVMRVIRTQAAGRHEGAEWFMDYYNSDGSLSEMCGNGLRLFTLHLIEEDLVDARLPIRVDTRDGVKIVNAEGDLLSVDMGTPTFHGASKVKTEDQVFEALHIEMGNPHAVAFVDDLNDAGALLDEPDYDRSRYRHGVNIEFAVRLGERRIGMRVHERGSGETRSCGTGACAAAVAAVLVDRVPRPVTYQVDVPGGTVQVTWTEDDRIFLAGPAEIVARGEMEWLR